MTPSNIDRNIINTFKKLGKDPDIILKPADKNLGLTVLDRKWYTTEAHRHLCNTNNYTAVKAEDIPIANIIKKLINLLNNMTNKKQRNPITKQQASFIKSCIEKYRVPTFYLLPKIHKAGDLKGRPIVSSVGWILHPLSKIIDDTLQPFLRLTPSYLKDSTDLLKTLLDLEIDTNTILITADVQNLYPSIPTPEGIEIVMKYLRTNPRFKALRIPPWLHQALYLVLTNNFTEFNNEYFLQISGTSMGSAAAVCYASLFLAALEEDDIKNINLLCYRRFIDDIFAVWKGSKIDAELFMQRLNSIHPNIKLDTDISTSTVNFLDITIYKENHNSKRLSTKVFQKEFNRFLYLPYFSYHSKATKKSFITSLLQSYLKINSSAANFYDIREKFFHRLRNRGYPSEMLLPIFKSVIYDENLRLLLLKKQKPESTEHTMPLTFKLQSSPSTELLHIKGFLRDCRLKLANKPVFKNLPRLTLCLKKARTLASYAVKSKFANQVPAINASKNVSQ